MLSQRKLTISFGVFIFLISVACVGPNNLISQSATSKGEQSIVWESEPRLVGEGSGLQLMLRTSEGMNFVYAAPSEEGGQDLLYVTSHNVGDTFKTKYKINTTPGEVSSHGENEPRILAGTGIGMFAGWQGGRDFKFARSMNFGRSFTPAITINDDEGGKASHSFQTMEVGPDGTIYAAWLDSRNRKTDPPGTQSLYLARSVNRGASFEKNIKITSGVCPCCRPSIAFGDSGKVFITWRQVFEGDNRIVVVATSENKGQTWSAPVRVTQEGWRINGCPHSGPSMKYVNGKLFVVWYTGADNKPSLRAGRSSDDGKSFEFLGEVQGRVHDANHPNVKIINDKAWVIFQGRDPGSKDEWAKVSPWVISITSEGRFSSPAQLPSLGDSVSYPSIFPGTGGRVYATWTELAENGPKTVLCRGRLHN